MLRNTERVYVTGRSALLYLQVGIVDSFLGPTVVLPGLTVRISNTQLRLKPKHTVARAATRCIATRLESQTHSVYQCERVKPRRSRECA